MSAIDQIRAQITADGPISFSRYMELALYAPAQGFYEAGGGAGRSRDFLTSPEVGPLFGKVVGQALDTWWTELGRPDPFFVIDAGAGPGSLSRGIRHSGCACVSSLRVILVDRAAEQRSRHGDYLDISPLDQVLDPTPTGLPLFASTDALPSQIAGAGVVLANELLDNLPFDLFEYRPASGWHEIRIGVAEDGGLVEIGGRTDYAPPAVRSAKGSRVVAGRPQDQDMVLRVPAQDAAQDWLRSALQCLNAGRVVVFDYAVERYPVGGRKWLRTFHRHQAGTDPLDEPGSQDITADVAIDQLGQVKAPFANRSQAQWLRLHGITELVEEGRAYWAANASTADLKAVRFRSRIKESEALLDRSGLGAFRVIEWLVEPRA